MRILGIGTATPELAVEQSVAAALSAPLAGAEGRRRRLLEQLYQRAGVRSRHSVVLRRRGGRLVQELFPAPASAEDRGPGTAARMAHYERHALPLAAAAAREALANAGVGAGEIGDVITVSCTGFYAPGLDTGLVQELGLSADTPRAHLGFMGCHGVFNALARAADALARRPHTRVLVASVELCSLHYQYGWDSDRLVSNALFADGAAALVCAADGAGVGGLRVGGHACRLFPDSRDAMTWRIGDHGFEMTLSAAVPALIERHVAAWLRGWLDSQRIAPERVRWWAVHPGGPRILTAFEEAMALPPAALEGPRAVLARCGNMSSATIAFVLREFGVPANGGVGVAVGFGPGLVAECFWFGEGDGGGDDEAC